MDFRGAYGVRGWLGRMALAAMFLGCDSAPAPSDGGMLRDLAIELALLDLPTVDTAPTRCTRDSECGDGVFCNGVERCLPAESSADVRGCLAPNIAACLAGQSCDEARDLCLSDCDRNGDVDRDGHRAGNCGGDDCDDADPQRYPGRMEVCDSSDHDEDCDPTTFGFRDADMDSHPDGRCCNVARGVDGGSGRVCGDDCNDSRPDIHLGAAETCDGSDNNCNGMTDEGALRVFHPDNDGDGFGNRAGMTTEACRPPPRFAENATDCDDLHANVHPGAPEVCDVAMLDEDCDGTANPAALCMCVGSVSRGCTLRGVCSAGTERCVEGSYGLCSIRPTTESCNGLDDNCDGLSDEMLLVACFADADNDGYAGSGARRFDSCPVQGREAVGGCPSHQTNRAPMGELIDCLDSDPARRPGAMELCNTADDNCDGVLDEGVQRLFYPDRDGDMYGEAMGMAVRGCIAPMGYVANNSDCDDGRPTRNPSAPEACDGLDNDCNGLIDEAGGFVVFRDRDSDSWGIATDTRSGCGTPPVGYASRAGDCDDADPSRFPGAPEVCDNRDNDCNTATYFPGDIDRDGHDPLSCGGNDCNESDPTVYGTAPELCDRRDNDCSSGGGVDSTEDSDSDGHTARTNACVGGPLPRDDCDDTRATVFPGAVERCNSLDDNCDGTVDELPAAALACGFTNAAATCAFGMCALVSCNAPFLDCDGLVTNGCEIDPRTSLANCGGCGFACTGPSGLVSCVSGMCTNCPPGLGDCDGVVANGCETNLATSGAHCGGCGRACSPTNAVGACVASACTVARCTAPYGDCDGNAANGCETNLSTTLTNCGTCGTTCLVAANATPSCTAGVCGAGVCATGYHRCGIECLPNDSVFTCGTSCVACPGASNGTAECSASGVCSLRCLPNTGDCDGIAANGCETTLVPGQQCCAGRACSGRCVSRVCQGAQELVLAERNTCGLFTDHAVRCLGDSSFDRDAVAHFQLASTFYSVVLWSALLVTRNSDQAINACRAIRTGAQSSSTCYFNGSALSGRGAVDVVEVQAGFVFQEQGDSRVYYQRLSQPPSTLGFGPLYSTGLRSDLAGSFTQLVLAEIGFPLICGRDGSGNVSCTGLYGNPGYQRTDGMVEAMAGGSEGVGGRASFCFLLNDGAVQCNRFATSEVRPLYGMLGNGTTGNSTSPVSVSGLLNAISVAFGKNHYCALRADGSVSCWGQNLNGVLGDGTAIDRASPVSATAVLTRPARAIGAAIDHNCVVQTDGTTRCWGQAGAWLGTVCDAPLPSVRVTPAPVSWPASTQLALGANFGCIVASDGVPRCVGANAEGQLADGTTTDRSTFHAVTGITNSTAIAASPGGRSLCALLTDGSARCWGANTYGQLGDGTTSTPRISPRTLVGITTATQIVLGTTHGCALLADRSVQCWGANSSGQLGDGGTSARSTPAVVPGLTNVVALAAGDSFTCAVLGDGSLRCWGANSNGQLGDGTRTNRLVPTRVLLVDNAASIASGGSHTCALRSDGSVRCWGLASSGQLGNGSSLVAAWAVSVQNLTGALRIVAGDRATCAQIASGWRCWGNNSVGQLGVGDTQNRALPSPVVRLPATHTFVMGDNRACAYAPDGTVSCWGDNGAGLLWPNAATTVCSVNWGTL